MSLGKRWTITIRLANGGVIAHSVRAATEAAAIRLIQKSWGTWARLEIVEDES
jgi:hypothetical protein